LDDLDMVTPGSIQHMGGNSLALIRHLTDQQASGGLLSKPRSSSKSFYFSLYGTHPTFAPRPLAARYCCRQFLY
jgi:hypothetical protein